ncbi:MAG: VWA domain-containing protein [Planctomycetes bacterium]|nr:VWA domain-containing protein [Planctomycetota bacterium]
MPAPKMLAGLPKPVLFGLYGAVGGLLGALAFGELVWWALAPQVAAKPAPEPRLALSAAKELQVYQGGTNKLFVKILREDFDGEVAVRVDGLPAGVTAPDVKVPAGKTEVEIEVRAAYSAVAPTASLRVIASGPGGKPVSEPAEVKLATLPSPMPQADIIFVLDVTASMSEQIRGLQNGIGTFADDLSRAKVDARFGCVAFRDLFHREPAGWQQMEVLKFKGETFTSDARAFGDEVGKQVASGGDDFPETSFEALAEAAKFTDWRKSATRVLVLITDAAPKIEAQPPQGMSVKDTVGVLAENKIDQLHLVINQFGRTNYREVQQGVLGVGKDKGKEFSLDRTARNAKAFTDTLLPEMTTAIVTAAEAKRPTSEPELAKKPDAPPGVKGVQSDATYDRSAAGQLVLAVGVWTGAIAGLVCLFLVGGQHHYLRGALPSAGGALAGLAGGLLVGVAGGAAGQGLFLLADTDSKVLDALFRVMGWTILGALAGLGLSLFVPNLKRAYGLAGGAAGGAAGAVGYLVVSAFATAFLGRLAGGLVLGLFIGLMVAVVEAAFRRAWLEVRYGPRETVTVNLGAEPVKIGGDARACTVWARGAADVALRYFLRDGQVICTDVPARSEAPVSDGDTREVGKVTVVVRTGTSSAPVAPAPRPAPPPLPKLAKPQAAPAPAKPLSLDDDLPAFDAAPVAKPQAAAPKPPAPPVAKPQAASTARDPDACPSCGRKNPGRPGSRFCMMCDQTY